MSFIKNRIENYDSSVVSRNILIEFIGIDQKRLHELWKYIFTEKPPSSYRAAAVFADIFNIHPELILPYLKEMVYSLKNTNHSSIRKSFCRIISQIEMIPENCVSKIIDSSLELLGSYKEPTSVKIYCAKILRKISQEIPEIVNEFKIILEGEMNRNTVGFRNRGRKILKELEST